MKVSIVGMGYVGIVSAVTFAKSGHEVICLDIDEEKVEMVRGGKAPIYEPGLEELLQTTVGDGWLEATTDLDAAVRNSEMTLICVGTPSRPDGSMDISYVEAAAEQIGKAIKEKKGWHTVVTKSTVVPTTGKEKIVPLIEKSSGKPYGRGWGYGSNPEFLREGMAMEDSFNPDRIVAGADLRRTREHFVNLYTSFQCPKVFTSITTAEMIKYVANSFLAVKISFADEMARLCSALGIDVYEVMDAAALDKRICRPFLNAGLGYGGSCFPKDVKALRALFEERKVDALMMDATVKVNDVQPGWALGLLKEKVDTFKDKRIAVLGLAFKPETDDVRESRAFPLCTELLREGAAVVCYDTIALDNFKEHFQAKEKNLQFTDDLYKAVEGADAVIIQTAWEEICEMDLDKVKMLMKGAVILDGRRALKPGEARGKGFTYIGAGW